MLGRRCVAFVFALAFLPLSTEVPAQDVQPDQTIAVLVTTSSGAPTADDLVNYYRGPRLTTPPLQGLTVGNPQKVAYLIPVRAQGDFLAHLQARPDSARAQLERYVVVIYSVGTDLSAPLAALQGDPYVLAAYLTSIGDFSTLPSSETLEASYATEEPSTDPQYGRSDLNIDAAWQMAGGYALIADIDSGLYEHHAALEQFDAASHYVGGGFAPVHSMDVSLAGLVDPPQNSYDVDERRPMRVVDSACNPDPQNYPDMQPVTAGHGTHVAGLVGANRNAGLGVQGTCKRCAIAMWKTAYAFCDVVNGMGTVKLSPNPTSWGPALSLAADTGAQIANMSFGYPSHLPPTFCTTQSSEPMCLAITRARYSDVAIVASSGNRRTALDLPASDPRVISAGGFQQDLALWDMSPNCPPWPFSEECGSNYTLDPVYGAKQELVGSAQSVLSTTYPGYNWNPTLKCGDGFPGPGFGNGTGWCTGTSMAAPQIAGVLGILRSINPLVPVGANPSVAGSLRRVLASTTFEAQSTESWNPLTGYGRPDAAAAARKMLGRVAGAVARSRVTPLFRLYSTGAKDYADTTSPQMAVGMMINSTHAWQPVASLPTVPGYSSFPHDPADGPLAAPRASVYVMTTEYKPRSEWPSLVPLYLMDKDLPGGRDVDDFMLVTTTADIEYAHDHAYNLRAIQAYIYAPCTPEPGCIPPGAQRFYRACNAAASDCAAFLESESATFAAGGYTTTFPPIGGTKTLLGDAYPGTDSDGDGLPDGFEHVVGTSLIRIDSDGDGLTDAYEFPMAGVAFSDPCAGGIGARYCGADSIFRDGLEFL
ncbi:MAG TPA: S8 family serine peptidase [Rhodanobacteraceae bacterium]|nr:S8 family serine peptidase [Rhodanobacteraceae bacterium]